MSQSTIACVFPGQGSQSVGMLSELATHTPVIQDTFAEASAALVMICGMLLPMILMTY